MKHFNRSTIAISVASAASLAVSAFFMVNVELPPWSHYISALNVVVFALPAMWATRRWLGWTDAAVLWGTLGLYALLIETAAIYTGFPYGHFGYSDLLGHKLFGVTPWTVCLAWTPLMIGAYGIARALIDSRASRIAVAALVATIFDLTLDPGAVRLGFWQYEGVAGFYGVPLTNFAGWLLTAAIGAAFMEALFIFRRPLMVVPVQITSSAILIAFFWTMVAVWSGMMGPAIVGILILAGFSVFWNKFYFSFDQILVYVDESGRAIATGLKATVHHTNTQLHSAFSIFLFNESGQVLLQQRSLTKKTWPGVWSNSCCGHVMLYESVVDAAKRRVRFELGLRVTGLAEVLPDFRYRAEKNGIVENEICPVLVGLCTVTPRPNPDEVAAVKWVDWVDLLQEVSSPTSEISPWAIEEAQLLNANANFVQFLQRANLRISR